MQPHSRRFDGEVWYAAFSAPTLAGAHETPMSKTGWMLIVMMQEVRSDQKERAPEPSEHYRVRDEANSLRRIRVDDGALASQSRALSAF